MPNQGPLELSKVYQESFKYKKAGVIVSGVIPEDEYQLSLFSPNPDNQARKVMQVLDAIKHSNGRNNLKLAAQGFDRRWRVKNDKLSQRFTTRFDELLVIEI